MVNKVILLGNVGNDPEIKSFEGGNMMAMASLATSESYTSKKTNERVTTTEWHKLVFNNKLAEIVEKYVKKGDKLYIEGSIKTRSWEDQEGQKRYATEIRVNNMTMLGGKKDEGGKAPSAPLPPADDDDDSDLPF